MAVTSLDTTFVDLIEVIATNSVDIAAEEVEGVGREWFVPPGLVESPTDSAAVAEAFTRLGLSVDAIDAMQYGTTGQEMSVRVQVEYVSAAERAFRARHMSASRSRNQASARRAGHSLPLGPIDRVLIYAQDLLVAGSR